MGYREPELFRKLFKYIAEQMIIEEKWIAITYFTEQFEPKSKKIIYRYFERFLQLNLVKRIRVKNTPARTARYFYYLTPKGFRYYEWLCEHFI